MQMIKDSPVYHELARAGRVLYHSPRHLYSTLALSSLLAGPISCGDGPTRPKINSPPQGSLSVAPDSGIAQLNSRLRYSCTDPDGVDDISQSYVVIGNDTVRTKSLDTMVTFTQPAMVKGYCKDLAGHVSTAGPINIQVLQPSISQTATRINDIGIDYTATLENMTSATRKTIRNDTLISTKTITGPSYSETISGNLKGRTCFIGEVPEIRPDTVCVDIPNYLPTVNLSGLQTDMNEEGEIKIGLQSRFEDKNFEDHPHLRSAQSLDGKTMVNAVGDSVIINAVGDSTGQYRVNIEFGTLEGGISTSELRGTLYDLPTISGNLENSETDSGVQGTLRFYTINGNDTTLLRTKSSDSLGNNLTNPDGSFNFRINRRTSELEKIVVMARQETSGNPEGYVRTISIPAKDTSGVLIRAVPYGLYKDNPEMFRQFMQELATDAPNTRFDFNGEYLRNLPGFENFTGLERVRILDHDYFGDSIGTFTFGQQDSLKSEISDSNNISGIIGNYVINPDIIVFGNDSTFTDYTLDSLKHKIVQRQGVIVIVPRLDLPYAGLTEPHKSGTIGSGGTIYMNPIAHREGTLPHEFGHMFLGTGHPISMTSGETVMTNPSTIPKTGLADKKAGMLIYEPTFMVFPGAEYPHVDSLWNILRADFK